MDTDSLAISLFSRANSTTQAINIAREIQCYSLPYGGLGFTSHVLTYYTIICLWYGRKPMFPYRPVKYSWFDLALGVVGLCGSTAMSIITIAKCRNTWQLLVIAVWKLSLSLLNGLTAIHVATQCLRNSSRGQQEGAALEVPMGGMGGGPQLTSSTGQPAKLLRPMGSVPLWTIWYLPGMLAGMSGLMNLVKHSEGHVGVKKITIGFYIIVGLGVVHSVFILRGDCFEKCGEGDTIRSIQLPALELALFPVLSVLYCDWVLGMITTNLVGLPSKDSSAFYWTYFISKRLPMLSW